MLVRSFIFLIVNATLILGNKILNMRLRKAAIVRYSGLGPQMCEQTCGSRVDCDSYNYDLSTFNCELNFISAGTPENAANFLYSDDIQRTSGLFSSLTCASHQQYVQTVSGNVFCVTSDCGPEAVVANTVSRSEPSLRHIGATLKYQCRSGYRALGNQWSTCQTTGSWSTTDGCIRDCGGPPDIVNATRSTPGTVLNSVVTYTCDSPTVMMGSGDGTIRCTENGWTNVNNYCIMDCGDPPPLADASHSKTGTLLDSITTYSCKASTAMQGNGDGTIQCKETGWTNIENYCVVDCGQPNFNIPNSNLDSGPTIVDSERTYSCSFGYESDSSNTAVVCQSDGSWSSPNFQCVRICPSDWTESTTHDTCFKVYMSSKRWSIAKEACTDLGAKLMSLQTTAKRDYFFSYLINALQFDNEEVFIGGRKNSENWFWEADGSAISSQIWASNNPDPSKGACAIVHHEKDIKNKWCTSSFFYACEIL